MKKICLVNPGFYKYTIGGAEVQLYLIAKELIKNGFEVHYISDDIEKFEVYEGIHIHPLKSKNNQFNKLYMEFESIVSQIKPALFYQRGRKLSTYFVGKYAEINKIPFIFAASMDIDANKYKSANRIISQGKGLRRFLGLLYALRIDYLSLNGIKKADKILTQTSNQQFLFNKILNLETEVVKNFHDFPIGLVKKSEPPVVLWIASIKKWKQPEIFMNIARELKHFDCRFILAGRMADESYRSSIHKWKIENEKFDYIENVTFEKSNELIRNASIFINTSLSNEGFPNTFIQSWIRRTPTITLNFDPDNVISQNKLGFHSKSFENIVENIKQLIINKQLRDELAENSFNYVNQNYKRNESIDKLLHIINLLL